MGVITGGMHSKIITPREVIEITNGISCGKSGCGYGYFSGSYGSISGNPFDMVGEDITRFNWSSTSQLIFFGVGGSVSDSGWEKCEFYYNGVLQDTLRREDCSFTGGLWTSTNQMSNVFAVQDGITKCKFY